MLCDVSSASPTSSAARVRRRPAPPSRTIADHLGLDIVPGTGLLPACMPGTFETYMLVLRDYGTLRLRDVLEPAIGYAENGHPLVERACATIATVADLYREHWPTSAAVYLPGGKVPSQVRSSPTSACRDLRAHPQGGGSGRRRTRGGDRAGAARVEPGLRRRDHRRFCRNNEVMDVSGRPPQGRADGAGHGQVAPHAGGARPPRLWQLSRA